MNFDVKDIKSWANRHDVRTLSVTGFFGNSLSEIDDEIKRYNNGEKDRLHELYMISDNGCYCFGYALYFADTGASDRAPKIGLVERFNFGLLPRFNLSLVARFNFGLPNII